MVEDAIIKCISKSLNDINAKLSGQDNIEQAKNG